MIPLAHDKGLPADESWRDMQENSRNLARKTEESGGKDRGTRGRTRTDTLLRAGDFESPVSTNFTTLAKRAPLYQRLLLRQQVKALQFHEE